MKKNNFAKIIALSALLICNADCAFSRSLNDFPELKLIMSKFSIAMIGVAGFSILLYISLSIYNKFFVDAKIKDFNLRKDSLKTPANKDEAIMSFITRCRLK